MYLLQEAKEPKLQLLGSGTILREVLAAAEMLRKEWGIGANVWSVTSFTELRRDGMEVERARRLGGSGQSWVERCLGGTAGPVVAASDYVSAVPDLIRPYLSDTGARKCVALGTDGFGRSDSRAALRAFFEVDARSIVVAALAALQSPSVADARNRYGIDSGTRPPWQR
jgi:pyruvate dehydrogenase E1 component